MKERKLQEVERDIFALHRFIGVVLGRIQKFAVAGDETSFGLADTIFKVEYGYDMVAHAYFFPVDDEGNAFRR